ncbi:MAG: ABC transporter permease subunit [Paracoccaceae bacterium]
MALSTIDMGALQARLAALDEVRGRSLWADARKRFARNKAAVAGLVMLSFCLLFAIFGQALSPYTYDYTDFTIMGHAAELGAPSWAKGYYFGVDDLGRDLFARTAMGTRISLLVGVVAAVIAVVVGTLYGAVSGYVGGRVDSAMMRIVDILMAVPFMFVVILLLVIFGKSLIVLFMGIGLLSWLGMARIVRGQTLVLKGREFIEAARASGVSSWRIILRHIVPNLLGIVAVYATLLIPEMILTESFISFLGLGVQEPQTSLGELISEGAKTIRYGTLWQLGFPMAFFILTMFGFYFVGDGLRDALDPKDR